MLHILNISPEGTPLDGIHTYQVAINEFVLTTFTCKRVPGGAAKCLRAAADALDAQGESVYELIDFDRFATLARAVKG